MHSAIRLPSGPVERFVKFLDMQGHSGEQLAESLLNFLGEHGIDVKDCRGQSYDNASNMAGKYNGMQARIRQLNELAEYVPCAAHSLNLVGQFAAGCCQEAVIFFEFVQNIYTFFSASAYRWGLLTSALSEADSRKPVVKSMSDTRWSARADATKALLLSFQIIKRVLDGMAVDAEQKADCRQQARGLSIVLDKLETGKFGFFRNLQSLSTEEITQKSSQLVKSYPSDLENVLLDEMVHFSELLKTNLGKGNMLQMKKQKSSACIDL